MLCSKCQKREAKVFCTEIIDGQKKEQYLCEQCASEYASFHMSRDAMSEETIGGLLSSMLEAYKRRLGEDEKEEAEEEDDSVCKNCGLSWNEIRERGELGCEECYQAFRPQLIRSLKQVQGSTVHTGKKPRKKKRTESVHADISEIDRLSLMLQDAIEKEEFEKAAKLRDEIRAYHKKHSEKEEA